MNKKYLKYIVFIFLPFLLILVSSCGEDFGDNPIENKAPETGVFLVSDTSIAQQPSRLTVHWWGDDPDGLIVGYYFSWDSTNWHFTNKNDSLFALQIGVNDTSYNFLVSAVDNSGNGKYDVQIFQNNINYGAEPFTDKNGNGIYDNGEDFVDIGAIDPTPAKIKFPIKNTAPVISWNELSVLPDTSFPVMTFGWNASDLDGDNTIQFINVALNDTSNFVSLDGGVRIITIRTKDFNSANPLCDILIEGSSSNIFREKLSGLKFNDVNKFFVQAVDISGAKTSFIQLPDSGKSWFVKKPKGKLLVIDDYRTVDNTAQFYASMFDSLNLNDKYDVYDLLNQTPPYLNITFFETIKLFNLVFWYADNAPSLDLMNISAQRFMDGGGKIFFSIQFPQNVDLNLISGFLPILTDSSDYKTSILGNTIVSSDTTLPEYPKLQTSVSLFRVRAFYLSQLGVEPIYYLQGNSKKSFIGFRNSNKSLFFIGLPLSKLNAGQANVKKLMNKVIYEDFGFIP